MRSFLSQAGSPAVTLGLVLSLAAWYLVLGCAGSVAWGWDAFDLTSFRLFAILLLGNLAAAGVRALSERSILRAALSLSALFVLLSGAYACLFRFEGTVGLAEGEAYEPIPPLFRSVKKGALAPIPPLAFTVTSIDRDNKSGRAVIVQHGVAKEIGRKWERIGSSEIRYQKAGVAPLIVVSSKEKGELERTYVKLELDPPGAEDSFMFETLPYDFYLKKVKAKGAETAAYELNIRRGKLSLFYDRVASGQQVPVQSLEVSIQDERKFALLDIRTRPGLVLFQASVALLGLLAIGASAITVTRRK